MYRFIYLLVSVFVITAIIFIAKFTGNSIDFNSVDFYLNLITEVIGLTLSVLLIEIFGASILKYLEIKKNKAFNTYLNNRLNLITIRLRQKLLLLSINIENEYANIDDFTNSIDLTYLNTQESRAFFQGNGIVTQSFYRPILFFNEIEPLLKEIEILSKQLPQGLPNDIYDGLFRILSHDTYTWSIIGVQAQTYNSAWVTTFKDLLYEKYLGARKLIVGNTRLANQLK